jgi:Grx4 family monothiol glutaredoxin
MVQELQQPTDYDEILQSSLPVGNIIFYLLRSHSLPIFACIVIFFASEWHEPSKKGGQMSLVFQTLAQRYQEKLVFALLDAESLPTVSAKLRISVVPTFIGIRNGAVVWKLEGANPPELGKLVKRFAENPDDFSPMVVTPAPVDVNDRLRALVSSAPVMLFMKGNPDAAKCGFSRKTVEILRQNDIPFSSFDILSDEEVRSGLKKLFDWPTFPQLYINGQFVAGYDILNEMNAAQDGGVSMKKEFGIEHLSAAAASAKSSTAPADRPLTDEQVTRIRLLINQGPIMLFMKGTPDEPRCGFSRSAVKLFRDEDIPFESFDILSDNEVREGLKKFSDWPSYPQIYYRGALIGGLDILKEMKEESGSLKEHFPN